MLRARYIFADSMHKRTTLIIRDGAFLIIRPKKTRNPYSDFIAKTPRKILSQPGVEAGPSALAFINFKFILTLSNEPRKSPELAILIFMEDIYFHFYLFSTLFNVFVQGKREGSRR